MKHLPDQKPGGRVGWWLLTGDHGLMALTCRLAGSPRDPYGQRGGSARLLVSGLVLLLAGESPLFAQAPAPSVQWIETPRPSIDTIPVRRVPTSREDWGLSETDWATYRQHLAGPAGLWYAHLTPALVLGLQATTEAERERWARQVWAEEQQRLTTLLAFNRTYLRVARAELGPDADFFDEALLSALSPTVARNTPPQGRLQLFVRRDCSRCDQVARQVAATGRAVDIWYADARSDFEISQWARSLGLPADRVRHREITLNHDEGLLERVADRTTELPLLYPSTAFGDPVRLESLTGNDR